MSKPRNITVPKLSKEEEIMGQLERLDHYEGRVRDKINTARSMINGKSREGELHRQWLDKFAEKGYGLDLCCGSMPIKNAMGVDIEYLGPLCFGRTSGDRLGQKSNSADYIVTNYFEVFADPLSALHEWHRVLKPGGSLAFICRNAEWYDPEKQPSGPLCNPNRKHIQTPLTVGFYLHRAGFEVREVTIVNGDTIRVHAVKPLQQ